MEVSEILKDPNFLNLPNVEQSKVLQKVDKNYAALPEKEQSRVVSHALARGAMDFFQSNGWEKHHAAGITGNLDYESGGMNVDAQEKGGKGRYLAQWTSPNRVKGLMEYAASKGEQTPSFYTPLEYVNKELNGSEKKAGDLLRKTTNPKQSAMAFMDAYERPGITMAQRRIAAAVDHYNDRVRPASKGQEQTAVPGKKGLDIRKPEDLEAGAKEVEKYLTAGPQTGEIGTGIRKGLAKGAGKYISLLDAGLPDPDDPKAKPKTGEERAKEIEQNLSKKMGVDELPPPTTLGGKIKEGVGQGIPAIGEALLVSKGMGFVGQGLSKLPGISRIIEAAKDTPEVARILPWLQSLGKGAATFGGMGAMEPEQPLRQAGVGALTGASLGAINRFGPLTRGLGGAALFGGEEKLFNPNASTQDVAAQSVLGAGFNLMGGEGKSLKKPAAIDAYLQDQFSRSLSPKVGGKGDFGKIKNWHESASNVAKEIVWSGREGKLALGDPDKPSPLPRNALGFSQALSDTWWRLVGENRDALNKAGKDTLISEKTLADAMESRAKSLEKLTSPGVKGAAEYARQFVENIRNHGPYTLEDIQDEIASFNNNPNMKSYYQDSNPDTERNVKTDAVFADAAREQLYETVESQTGDAFKERRMLMRDIKRIEPEVAKRAVVNMRQPEKGFWNVTDSLIMMHLARSVATGNPVEAVIAGTGKGIAIWNKFKNQRDRILKNTFTTLDKNLGPRPQAERAAEPAKPKPPKLLPPPAIKMGQSQDTSFYPKPQPPGPQAARMGGGLKTQVGEGTPPVEVQPRVKPGAIRGPARPLTPQERADLELGKTPVGKAGGLPPTTVGSKPGLRTSPEAKETGMRPDRGFAVIGTRPDYIRHPEAPAAPGQASVKQGPLVAQGARGVETTIRAKEIPDPMQKTMRLLKEAKKKRQATKAKENAERWKTIGGEHGTD